MLTILKATVESNCKHISNILLLNCLKMLCVFTYLICYFNFIMWRRDFSCTQYVFIIQPTNLCNLCLVPSLNNTL